MQQHELMDLVTKLIDRIGVLEKDLQQTTNTYSTTLTRLILRVKKLEKNGRKISDIDTNPTISLVQPHQDMEYDMEYDFDATTSIPVTTAGLEISTAIMQVTEAPNKIKKRVQVQMSIDEELAKKVFEEEQARFNAEQEARFKVDEEQERIDFETALELQKQLDEREEVTA
ncbi:hypothetical protein Tco_0501925 [Tanacetum coccineum]